MKLTNGFLSTIYRLSGGLLSVISILLISASARAVTLNEVIAAGATKLNGAQVSQAKIDALSEQRRAAYDEYKAVLKEVDGLRIYNRQLDKQILNQLTEEERLKASIENVTVTERQITPLMIRMVEGLKQFVALDIPFLLDERNKNIAFIESLIDRSDITVAEKFRHIVEAYKTENDYGSTIEAYTGPIPVQTDGEGKIVDFLKVGRISFVYQTTDGKSAGVWDKTSKTWVELGGSYRSDIAEGVKIARKQAGSSLITLPVHAPENAQ